MRHSSPNHNWNQDGYFYTLVSKPLQGSAFSCQSVSRSPASPAASDWSQVSRALSQIFSYLAKHAAAIESVQYTFVVVSSLIVSLLTSSIVKILTTNREGSEIAARKYSYLSQYWQCQTDSWMENFFVRTPTLAVIQSVTYSCTSLKFREKMTKYCIFLYFCTAPGWNNSIHN